MSRILMGVVLAALVCAPLCVGDEKTKASPPASDKKAEAGDLRTLTGVVEKVKAKDEKNGSFVLAVGTPAMRYTFQVNPKTKVLRETADPLELGLKNPLLKGGRARVTFSEGMKGDRDVRVCRVLQLTKAAK